MGDVADVEFLLWLADGHPADGHPAEGNEEDANADMGDASMLADVTMSEAWYNSAPGMELSISFVCVVDRLFHQS